VVIEIDVLLFAGLRETLGRDRVRVELPDGARVRDLRERIAALHPMLAARLGAIAIAVNLDVAAPERPLAPGDEVALLPPVGGGAADDDDDDEGTLIALTEEPIDVARILAFVGDPSCGGVALFLGTARDVHDGRAVARLEYEAYPAMATKVLGELARATRARVPDVRKLALVHRLGLVPIGEASVAVAASAPHRAEAFDACRFAIDELKAKAPIWKKERFREGDARWVENRESGLS
jgi:molybdopterin synthase catalytic subunit